MNIAASARDGIGSNLPTYLITDWDARFENNRSRGNTKLAWVPFPNDQASDDYTQLVDHDNGAAHLGAWLAIIQVASKCNPRGTLVRDGSGKPHDANSLSRISRLPAAIFEELLPRLLDIGLIRILPGASTPAEALRIVTPQLGAGTPQASAVKPHQGAESPQASAASPQLGALNGMEWKERNRTEQKELKFCGEAENDEPPSDVFPSFLVVGGKDENAPKSWILQDSQIEEWKHVFPGVDVARKCREAHAWLKASPTKRKTYRGMTKCLFGWLQREQDKGRPPDRHFSPAQSGAERTSQLLDSHYAGKEAV